MSTIVIILVIFALGASVWLMIASVKQNRNKDGERLLKRLSRLGSSHNLGFSSQEVLHDSVLGFDGLQRKLLVMKKKGSVTKSKLIDLAEVKNCSVVRYYRPFRKAGKKSDPEQLLERVVLRFVFIDDSITEVEFYNHLRNSLAEAFHLSKKARHWETILTKLQSPVKRIA